MADVIKYRFRCRRRTAAEWGAVNEILLDSEIGLEDDTGLGKVGDGTTAWNDLLYTIVGRCNLTGIANGKILSWNATSKTWVVSDSGVLTSSEITALNNDSIALPNAFSMLSVNIGGNDYLIPAFRPQQTDPDFSSVMSLLHFDGTNGSQTFTDQTGLVWTPNNSGIVISSTSAKFGSCGLKGASGSILSAPLAGPSASGDFTVEAFIRSADVYSGAIAIQSGLNTYDSGAIRIGFYRNAVDLLCENAAGSFINLSSRAIASASANTWYHVAVCVSGGTNITAFVNGIVSSTFTSSTGLFQSSTTNLGTTSTAGNEAFLGDIDEFRVTDGVARYTSNFSPPTAPFPNS